MFFKSSATVLRAFGTTAILLLVAALSLRPAVAEPNTAEGLSPAVAVVQLTADQQAGILKEARFIVHAQGSAHGDIDAEFVSAVGLAPRIRFDCCGATYFFSPMFLLEGGRPARIAFVKALGNVEAHLVYRSNSQSCWRLCDVLDGHRYAKGYYEFDVQAPIPVTVVLHKLAEQESPVQLRLEDGEDPKATSLPEIVLKGLTEDARDGRKGGRLVPVVLQADDADDGRVPLCFVSRRYAERMPCYPERFAPVPKWLATAGGRMKVADPAELVLPDERSQPDFDKIEDRFHFHNPMYAEVHGGAGLLKGTVVRSRNGRIRYLFLETENGHVMLAAAELAEAPVSELGLRCRYLDLAGCDAPLIEYGDQIPEEYGGVKGGRYQSNWPYLRELPINKLYYEARQR